jgi:hypothetical protein
VNQTRDNFLTSAALAGDQHLRAGPRGIIHFFFNRADCRADANHADIHFRDLTSAFAVVIAKT